VIDPKSLFKNSSGSPLPFFMMPLGQLTDLKTWKGILSKLVYPVSLADFVDLDTDRINLTSK